MSALQMLGTGGMKGISSGRFKMEPQMQPPCQPAQPPTAFSGISLKKKVDECVEIIDKGVFSDWERDFLKSVQKQLRFGVTLSPKQVSAVESCYVKACRSPY